MLTELDTKSVEKVLIAMADLKTADGKRFDMPLMEKFECVVEFLDNIVGSDTARSLIYSETHK